MCMLLRLGRSVIVLFVILALLVQNWCFVDDEDGLGDGGMGDAHGIFVDDPTDMDDHSSKKARIE